MAHPIAFKPAAYDPKQGLMRRLEAAPAEHAEALLVAYDLLQAAHDEGLLDTLHGMVHAKDVIAGKVAEGARVQASVDALRNLVTVGRLLGSINPEALRAVDVAMAQTKPVGWWALIRQATSADARRGLGVAVGLLRALGSRR